MIVAQNCSVESKTVETVTQQVTWTAANTSVVGQTTTALILTWSAKLSAVG